MRSLANIVAAVYVVIGFIAGAAMSLLAMAGGEIGDHAGLSLAIFWMPLLYGVLGYVGGALTGWVYNRAAAYTGGIEIEVEP